MKSLPKKEYKMEKHGILIEREEKMSSFVDKSQRSDAIMMQVGYMSRL